jgi:hypothetical protein
MVWHKSNRNNILLSHTSQDQPQQFAFQRRLQFLWIVHFWLPLQYYPTFISIIVFYDSNVYHLLFWETGVPGENHQTAVSYWEILSHNGVSSTPHLNEVQTHNVSDDRHWLHRDHKPNLSCLCLFSHSGIQHILCCVFALFFFVLCTLRCQFLWIVHFWLPLQYYPTFSMSQNCLKYCVDGSFRFIRYSQLD